MYWLTNQSISDEDDDSEEIRIVSQERNADEQALAIDNMNAELLNLVEEENTGSSTTHPLEENQINLCEIAMNYLANKGNQKKLFLSEYSIQQIHSVFEKLDIPLPRLTESYRALAKAIFKYSSINCPDKCCNL